MGDDISMFLVGEDGKDVPPLPSECVGDMASGLGGGGGAPSIRRPDLLAATRQYKYIINKRQSKIIVSFFYSIST